MNFIKTEIERCPSWLTYIRNNICSINSRAAPLQFELAFPQRGGRRKGAGRKPTGKKAGVSHRARPKLNGRSPVHVTLRVRSDVGSLRTKRAYRALRNAIDFGAKGDGFRLQHYSIQGNHMHLIVEADDQVSLSRGMQGLKIRIAKRINRLMGRRGSVFADRYHAHVLESPRETRYALLYVLNNSRHHTGQRGPSHGPVDVDVLSSAIIFEGWNRAVRPPTSPELWPPFLPPPKTWLLQAGWRLGGLLDPAACPG